MKRVHNKPIGEEEEAPSSAASVKHFIKKQSNHGGATAAAENMQEPSIETDKLSYEIFSILESKFLFGYDDAKLMESRSRDPSPETTVVEAVNGNGVSVKNQRGKVCVLCIDGGGMRGILPGKALAYLEHALKSKSGDPNARIADYFDVASGSGTGGIFTAMLFASKDGERPMFKAEDTWRFLAENGKSFYKSPPGFVNRVMKTGSGSGPGSNLEKLMKESFGELTLKDTLKPVLIPCYDLTSSGPFLFSRADALETDGYDFNLWEVCKATWAEPGVFEPVEMRSVDGKTRCVAVDGSLAMSNPTAAAITHVLHNKQEFPFVRGVEDMLVLSLGSGQLVDVKYDCDKVMKWKAKHWARPSVRVSSDAAADTVDQAVSAAFGQCRRSNYVRIQANGSSLGPCRPNVDTDASPSNVNMLMRIAEEMLKQKNVESVMFGGKKINEESNFEKLDWLAGELVLEHQRRSSRIAPTVAFKQSGDRRTDDDEIEKTVFKDIDCMF